MTKSWNESIRICPEKENIICHRTVTPDRQQSKLVLLRWSGSKKWVPSLRCGGRGRALRRDLLRTSSGWSLTGAGVGGFGIAVGADAGADDTAVDTGAACGVATGSAIVRIWDDAAAVNFAGAVMCAAYCAANTTTNDDDDDDDDRCNPPSLAIPRHLRKGGLGKILRLTFLVGEGYGAGAVSICK